jgi:hypothetical protein
MAANHMILVPGHAVWSGRGDPYNSLTWFLKPFQVNEPAFLIAHLQAGIELAAADRDSLLILSGGPTELLAGPRSEALGYFDLADRADFWGHSEVRDRCALEEYALDSFLNLLFGLCRFQEVAGLWPSRITVAGWGFKARRFAELHRAALRWELPFESLAVNDPPELEIAAHREAATRLQWAVDPYGRHAPLSEKRAERDHFHRVPPYSLTCPELADLLRHSGPQRFTGPLPWDR